MKDIVSEAMPNPEAQEKVRKTLRISISEICVSENITAGAFKTAVCTRVGRIRGWTYIYDVYTAYFISQKLM